MPTTIKTVSPFFNDTTAPPPFPPMLTDQLELFGNNHHSSGLLVDEALSPESGKPTPAVKADLERPQKPTVAPKFRIAAVPPLKLIHAFSPYPKKTPKQFRNRTPSESVSEQSLASSSDDESIFSTLSEDSKIPKPPGEPGQPGRGGYNLETTLDWNHKTYAKFKKFTHCLINDHLDVTKCSSTQSPTLLKVVRDKQCTSTDFTKVLEAFPDLEGYSNCWPVNNMIMMRLKYTSSRARCQELDMAAGKGKKSSALVGALLSQLET
ncbi:hypothetical protein HD554DRAFT_2040588 [Boletus coccyginus]|nr:hypothetical protein HD554DRAFT_2040588 [Boletus coccyginus]